MLGLISCVQKTKPKTQVDNVQDTVIAKYKNKPYDVGFYSKSYSYYWLVGNDTLDFVVRATEREKDSTLDLIVHHKSPILFTTMLTRINECYPLIKEDFFMSKLNSFYFKEPIYYFDLAKELSTEYEQQFGRKNISYKTLNRFLLNSKMNNQLNSFVNPLNKKIKRYSIEKFHLIDKKYYTSYLPNIDLTEYPEFTIITCH
jgi:hypothetical protein